MEVKLSEISKNAAVLREKRSSHSKTSKAIWSLGLVLFRIFTRQDGCYFVFGVCRGIFFFWTVCGFVHLIDEVPCCHRTGVLFLFHHVRFHAGIIGVCSLRATVLVYLRALQ